ncbi:MAG: YbgA family protein [Promethearchaeota archaeon]
MKDFLKPKVVISRCIEFDHCRWNGNIIKSPFVEILKSYVDFQPVCAEVEIGLGIPRDPVRIVKEESLKLIQVSSLKDYTKKMEAFAKDYLNSIDLIDGFILKSKSPSCGIKESKYYFDTKPGSAVIDKGAGLFGREVLKFFPNTAIESEGRLMNFRIREHWLTKLYTLKNFRNVKDSESHHMLVDFQAKNKFLFMAYNQNLMRMLGKIVANPLKKRFNSIIDEYEKFLFNLLNKPPEYTSHINVLMHILGYFKKELNAQEKAFFLDELEKFRAGWIPLFIMIELIKSWMMRAEKTYLQEQSYFNPYPEELMNFDIKDAWRGRTYWNPPEKR